MKIVHENFDKEDFVEITLNKSDMTELQEGHAIDKDLNIFGKKINITVYLPKTKGFHAPQERQKQSSSKREYKRDAEFGPSEESGYSCCLE